MGGILPISKVLSTKLTFGANPMNQIWLGYIRTFTDYLNEPDSAGIGPWLTTPMIQIWLGYTVGTLADHLNDPNSADVYNKNPTIIPQKYLSCLILYTYTYLKSVLFPVTLSLSYVRTRGRYREVCLLS